MTRARRTLPDVSGDWTFSDVFTDRVPESRVFAESLTAHRRRLDGTADSPQGRNTLVFHGHSGLGKSELSRRLEAWCTSEARPRPWGPRASEAPEHWGSRPGSAGGPPEVHATARIDLFQTQGYVDGARVLAELRIELGSLRDAWPLFDLAFSAYWASTHPGEDLPGTNDKQRSSDFSAQALDLLSTLSEEAGQVLGAATMALRFTQWVREGLGPRLRRHGISTPTGFDELVRRCANEPTPERPLPELLAALGHVLAYEIDEHGEEAPLVVVFLDTFERLRLDQRGEAEALLNRIVWAMDNVLFVVTGQWRLLWAEPDAIEGLHRGPALWPLLRAEADDEPRQHSLARLSESDQHDLLVRVRDEHGLPLSDDVLAAVAERSGGLPEYLRLAVEAVRVQVRNGQAVTADSAGVNLAALVRRLFEDVPPDEQKAVRAAALFRTSYVRLVAAAAGVDEGAAKRALARPFFDTANRVDGDRAMHDTIRNVIRTAGHDAPGGWSDADWNAAGTRALAFLEMRYREVKEQYAAASLAGDAAQRAECARNLLRIVGAAVTVVCDVEATVAPATGRGYGDWLSEAVVKGPSITGLLPFVPALSGTVPGRDLIDFISAKSATLPHQERVDTLRRLAADSAALHWIAGRHLAYTMRDVGEWDEALGVFDSLLVQRPGNAFIARQKWVTLIEARRYARALESVDPLASDQQEQLRHYLSRDHGAPDDWLGWTARWVARARRIGNLKDELLHEGSLLRWNAFVGRGTAADAVDLQNRATVAGHDGALRDALLAAVLSTGRPDHVLTSQLDAMDRAQNGGHLGVRTAWARAAAAFLVDDHAALEALAAEIGERPWPRSDRWIPVEMLLVRTGHPVPEEPTGWIEPYDVVAARWAQLWDAWRDRVRTSRDRSPRP